MTRAATAAIAGLSLVLAFAVGQGTGVRALGGAVLVAGVVWCVVREARRTAWWRLVVALVGLGCFIASHLLGEALGVWPAVLLAAAVLGGATYGLIDRSIEAG